MPFEDEIRLLRRQRSARRAGRTVEDAWRTLDTDEGLSTKEKLQSLIALTVPGERKGRGRQAKLSTAAPTVRRSPALRIFENPYPLHVRYGRVTLASGLRYDPSRLGLLLRSSGGSDEPAAFDLGRALFIDLETTGLAGGTGTLPFLVGMGYYRDERFHVIQHFLEDPAAEGEFVRGLGRFFEEMGFTSLVSYNGKLFDLPILETRFILQRTPFPLDGLPHLDFLFAARTLWKHKYDSCRLFHLAREVVRAERSEDIPSAEIPVRYFEYLRSGDFGLIEPILYHNQEDILSLLGIVIAGLDLIMAADEACERGDPADAMDLYGAGRFFERAGEAATSAHYYEQALRGGLSRETAAAARRRLSAHFKRAKDFDRAVALWSEMCEADQLASYRELAIYYEHRAKDLSKALVLAEEGLARADREASDPFRADFQHRIERLQAKIGRTVSPPRSLRRPK
ncbi:MAG: ribonuclease H-like domain-containing protein [Candidatus Aminicenantes bacterium]|nr:ribonuclease H-like domain-containing protein [Candidatus Aminicenantes bacterium]